MKVKFKLQELERNCLQAFAIVQSIFFQIPFCFAYLNTVACRGPVMPEATAWYSGTAEQQ